MGASVWTSMLIGSMATAAWLVAVWSAFRAWRVSERHQPYRSLGWRRHATWMGALKHMPAEAMPHLRRFYTAVAFFFAIAGAALITGVISARS